jgi:hypothetical protein
MLLNGSLDGVEGDGTKDEERHDGWCGFGSVN